MFSIQYFSLAIFVAVTGLVSILKLNPGISLSVGLLYLPIALWRLIGTGRSGTKSVGTNWSSLWRTLVLFSVVAISELLVMGTASRIALMMH